jgi:hypothetical protein
VFLIISDSIEAWEKRKNYIQLSSSFIRDGNNHRILMNYPKLDITLTYSLKFYPLEILEDNQTILINKNLEKRDRKLLKEEKKRVRKLKNKQVESKSNDEENFVPIITNFPTHKSNYLLRWTTLILLVFSLFIFVGVQRIVKDELTKIKN